jgi:hypothetical protein
MPLGPSAPYDTLATVTALTRTVLADYIQGIVPNPQGTVNTNGTIVTWVSGAMFTAYFSGAGISINGVSNQVDHLTGPTGLVLTSSAGIQAGVAYVATIPTGDIFADSQAYVLPTINLAWRKLQEKLDYSSHPRMRGDVDILNIPVAGSSDPATQQWINWVNFFDGVNLFTTPTLPQDFISPLRLYERLSGTTSGFQEMHPVTDGLPSRAKNTLNRLWDWREDAIYFVGATVPLDLRIQYEMFLPDLVVAGGGFGSTIIPIMRAGRALSYYTAQLFVTPRGGSLLAPDFESKGDLACDALTSRQSKLLQRGSFRRRAVYDSSGHYSRYR